MTILDDKEVDEVFILHLQVLQYLLNNQSFSWIKKTLKDSFEQKKYLEIVTKSRLLSFDTEDNLIGAYPISPFKTPYEVKVEGIGSGYAMCAIDALGVAYTFNKKTTIDTIDNSTKAPLQFTIDPGLQDQQQKNVLVSYDPMCFTKENRANVVSATQICPTINFYSSQETNQNKKDMAYLSFEQALLSAKKEFSPEALKCCIKNQAPKFEALSDWDIPLL
ncbi:MAG: organomercurial lyase [Candidatus Hodarchaeales archaeon]|jgi:hypothetical protein